MNILKISVNKIQITKNNLGSVLYKFFFSFMAVLKKKKKLENILNMCKSKAYSSPKIDKCYVWNRTYL